LKKRGKNGIIIRGTTTHAQMLGKCSKSSLADHLMKELHPKCAPQIIHLLPPKYKTMGMFQKKKYKK
jgi:hypothetical protein